MRRRRRGKDRREVLLSLTPKGERVLRELSLHYRTELHSRSHLDLRAAARDARNKEFRPLR